MPEEKLEVKKLRERLQYGIELVKEEAKKENIVFDKELFLAGIKLGETMFVRSEVAYNKSKQ